MKILIIGKIPPPIGGVTVHIKRFIEHLERHNLTYILLNYSNILNYLKVFKSYDIAHIHVSNKKLRVMLLILLKLLRKNTIVTFHGKYNFINKWDRISLKLSTKNILLNDYSKNFADRHSKNNVLIGAFIPPSTLNNSLNIDTEKKLFEFRKKYRHIFCMNASNMAFDSEGNEIYQGTQIIDFFSKNPNLGLIFSDPSKNHLIKYNKIPSNIFFITEKHEFVDVFKYSNYLLRYTTTDGDSLSVKEALYFNLNVMASNCVERPEGVILLNNINDILIYINNTNQVVKKPTNNYNTIINLYKQVSKYE
ncbi:hypothetical protein [Empedobacter falsenii]|uniref:hypothetical protein n=1 Tax=Empedobacter falsenii TaxID=343874 RepID=UPI003A80215D